MLAPSKTIATAPVEPLPLGQPPVPPMPTGQPASPTGLPPAQAVAQYILGDEHIEVEMRVDLLTTLPPPESSSASPGEKSPKPTAKEGAKKP